MSQMFEIINTAVNNFDNVVMPEDAIDATIAKVYHAPKHDSTIKYRFRASGIGKPWILQMLERWYGGGKPGISPVSLSRMVFGNLSQEVAADALRMQGFNVVQEQLLEYMGVGGHADMLITIGNYTIVLECKCMADFVLRKFRDAPNDDYGYVSQLSLYSEAVRELGFPNVTQAFLLQDRSSCKWTLVPLTDFARDAKIQRLQSALRAVNQVPDYDVDALLEHVPIPPLTIKGELLPSLRGSRWAKVLYNSNDGKVWTSRSLDVVGDVLKSLPPCREDGQTLVNTQQ
jgi:hypothetical protein